MDIIQQLAQYILENVEPAEGKAGTHQTLKLASLSGTRVTDSSGQEYTLSAQGFVTLRKVKNPAERLAAQFARRTGAELSPEVRAALATLAKAIPQDR